MQSSLKKSLYLGLAALSFASVAAVSTTASAKSYAKAGAYTTLTTDATKRNVEATGSNALYTKPGTVKGAKVVASKATMAKLATSKKSADYFRAYGQKVTNRGSVYYRVVTMNGKYRGYIYGGKTEGTFAGGVKAAETTTKATMPLNKTVYFANPGKTNVTWTAPKYTQYKASKNVVNTTPFAGDTLTITDAVTKTREGSLYYYVKDAQHPSVSGWIYSKAVTTDKNVAFNQATDVKVNFSYNGTTVTSGVLQKLSKNNDANNGVSTSAADTVGTGVGFDAQAKAKATTTTDGPTWAQTQLTGTGYTVDLSTASNTAALLGAKTGDSITLTVTKNSEVTTPIHLFIDNASGATGATTLTDAAATGATASATTVNRPTLTTGFKGADGSTFTADTLSTWAKANSLGTLSTPTYKDADGNDVHTVYTLSKADKGTYGNGSAANLYYTGTVVNGAADSTNTGSTTDNGDIFG